MANLTGNVAPRSMGAHASQAEITHPVNVYRTDRSQHTSEEREHAGQVTQLQRHPVRNKATVLGTYFTSFRIKELTFKSLLSEMEPTGIALTPPQSSGT